MKNYVIAAAMAIAGAAGSAQATTIVQMDVNSVTAVASNGGFGTNYTGSLTLSTNANTRLEAMLKNEAPAAGFGGPYAGANVSFDAIFNFNAGAITGIGYTLKVSSGLNGVLNNIYMASVVPGSGGIIFHPGSLPGQPEFFVAAATEGGSFNSATFGGVDVSEFLGFDLPGNFLNFKLHGNAINSASRTDNDVDIDIFVTTNIIPLPTPVGLACAGLVGIAAVRRRRD